VTHSSLTEFKRRFPEVAAIMRGSPSYRIDIVEPHASTGSADPIVFFRHENGRAFGCAWNVADHTLAGLRSRTYDPARGAEAQRERLARDDRANGEFLSELRRRLSTDGRAREEVADGLGISGLHYSHLPRMRHGLARRAF
jgi:hypothetical protein